MASNAVRVATPSNLRTLSKENSKALRLLKKVDPRERYVVLFPDAESVWPGIGFKLLGIKSAEQVYERASDFLKKDILKMCLTASKSELYDSQENRQVAAFVTSHAVITKYGDERPAVIERSKAAGGFGTGFINSLVFSGAMKFEDGLELVHKQSQAMDRVARVVPSAKLKVFVRPATKKHRVCQAAIEHCLKKGIPKEVAVCSVSKQTRPQVVEISGHEEAIRFLEEEGTRLFEFKGCSRVTKVKHAFHTDLMTPVSDFLRMFINAKLNEQPDYIKEELVSSQCSVFSATSGCRLRALKNIKKDLINHPVKQLKCEALLKTLYDRPPTLPMPNTLVLWDRKLFNTLCFINRKAGESAKLLEA